MPINQERKTSFYYLILRRNYVDDYIKDNETKWMIPLTTDF